MLTTLSTGPTPASNTGVASTSPARRRVARAQVHRWIDHTSEVELEIEADTEAEIFGDALLAFRELLHEESERPAHERRSFEATGEDRAALLADFIEELVYLAETQGFIPLAAEAVELVDGRLRATLCGSLGDPAHVVKAVTYHRLAFEPVGNGGGYRARVVLDV